ncbi:MAG: DUF4091 domain-containing protein [Armatimonadetes bacterium]|nr:DUF4091 domain-containing protein [Armatimonadota bacterium]
MYQVMLFLSLGLLGLAAPALGAPTVLLDFETDADLDVWHYERAAPGTPVNELSRVDRYATSGNSALRFASPAWKQGMSEWPSFECKPPITDWSAFDRLVYDVTNPTAGEQLLFLFISDTKIATRDGYQERTVLPPFASVRVVIPLAKLSERKINLADIGVLHFFTERPPSDMELFIDQMVLLRAGEPLPPVSPAYLKQVAPLQAPRVEALRRRLQATRDRVRGVTEGVPEAAAWADTALQKLEGEVDSFANMVARADAGMLAAQSGLEDLGKQLDSIETRAKLRGDFGRVRPAVQVGRRPHPDLVVGFATAMEKVLPRAMTTPLNVSRRMEVALARGEKESFQVIVLPCERDVRQVRVRATTLRAADGTRFPARNVESAVVGYVETKTSPPYGSSHIGWWPDPILNFQQTADIATGDAQAFWVRVRAPKNQKPGLYRGKLEVLVDGARTFSFDLAIRVYRFRLPDSTPLPLAVTFWPMYYEPNGQGGWNEGELRDSSWRKHRWQWADFLADYYLTYDSLYGFKSWEPDFEILARLHKQGRLGRFNLGYYGVCGETPEEIERWRKSTVDVIRPRYEKARELGLLDHAYIYGCDENPPELFPGVQRAVEILKREFPDVFVLTTTYDNSFGQDSVIKAMDGFCPLTPSYDAAKAAVARQAGKEVWWYICCGPGHPFANMFIEFPAIEGRLLMGAMTAKYRPDGFLYYQISIWNSGPIERGPFTNWDPRCWPTYHGDGSWTCLGPDGTPLPTIRLENFRDGLEDYAYFRILEETVKKVEASPDLRARQANWLAQAREALQVPEEVVKSLTEYTYDPAAVARWRARLAEVIEAAGVAPAEL